jgi:hypothetical protein
MPAPRRLRSRCAGGLSEPDWYSVIDGDYGEQHRIVSADRAGVMETMRRHIGALMERASRILTSVRTQETTKHAVAPGALAVSK